VHFIRAYYGEKIGFYFAFLLFYTSWLLVPAVPGVALTAYQLSVGQVDTKWNIWYSVFVAVWSTVMFEFWKRTQSTLSHLWDMDAPNAGDKEREGFKHEISIQPSTGKIKKKNFVNTGMRKLFVTFPTVLFAIIVVVGVFTGYRIWYRSTSSYFAQTGAALANAVLIIGFG